jgi:hypothetical protein
MPRPCAVEVHAHSYQQPTGKMEDATALRRGGSRLPLQIVIGEDHERETPLGKGKRLLPTFL